MLAAAGRRTADALSKGQSHLRGFALTVDLRIVRSAYQVVEGYAEIVR